VLKLDTTSSAGDEYPNEEITPSVSVTIARYTFPFILSEIEEIVRV
jgi:hypothetical protein